MLTETILNCVTHQSGTPTQQPRARKTSQSPWFKGIKLKNKKRSLARKLKHSPQDTKIRELLYLTERNLHHLVRKNKIEYKRPLIEKLQ